MKKYLLFLATLFIVWLCVTTYLHFQLQQDKITLNRSKHSLEQDKLILDKSKHNLEIEKQAHNEIFSQYELKSTIQGNYLSLFRLNKETGEVYLYHPWRDSGGWVKIVDSGLQTAPSIEALEKADSKVKELEKYYKQKSEPSQLQRKVTPEELSKHYEKINSTKEQ